MFSDRRTDRSPRLRFATLALVPAIATIVVVPGEARAESASALLQLGKDQVQKGQIDEGCKTLARAEALGPNVDSIGLVAACHEKQGRIASAYLEYIETANRAATAGDDREGYARNQAAHLEPEVPRLTVRVAAGEHPSIEVGGKPVEASAVGTPMMIDPGPVDVIARDPSGHVWRAAIKLDKGSKEVVDVPPSASWIGGTAPGPRRYAKGPPPSAIVAGTIGLAGLGVFAGGGIAAVVLNGKSEDIDQANTCNHVAKNAACAEGRDKRDQAVAAGTAADVGLGIGVAGIVTSAFLWGFHAGAKELPAERASALFPAQIDVVPLAGGGVVTFGWTD